MVGKFELHGYFTVFHGVELTVLRPLQWAQAAMDDVQWPYEIPEPYLPLSIIAKLTDISGEYGMEMFGAIPGSEWIQHSPKLTTRGHALLSQGLAMPLPDQHPGRVERKVESWVSHRLGFFLGAECGIDKRGKTRPLVIRLPELWWIALHTTSHLTGLYTAPSAAFIAAIRERVGFAAAETLTTVPPPRRRLT